MIRMQSYKNGAVPRLLAPTPIQQKKCVRKSNHSTAIQRADRRLSHHPNLSSLGHKSKTTLERCSVMTHSGAVLGLTHVGAQWLIGIGVFVLCLATSIFLITAITTLREVQIAARRVTIVMRLLELEMPETMAAMRLSSLEISDCIEEFTGLGTDLASGIRSSANFLSAAERGIHQGTHLVKQSILPAIRSKAPEAKNALEEMLRERASLHRDVALTRDITQPTSQTLKSLRKSVASIGMGLKAAAFWRANVPPRFPNPPQPDE